MNDTQRFTLFRKDLLRWFAENRRPLPWRADYTPYRTWIAEVMMQQTQMDRGVQYFLRWMERFPDVAAVAAAPEEDLLKAWEGLGYYRRARNIQAAARVIMERHGGNFPTSYADILALPGVGPYTAGAIASTAYNEEVPCVDGNCRIREVSRAIAEFEQCFEREYRLSMNEGVLLCCLARHGELSSGEIAEMLRLTCSNTSKVIRSVEGKGFVIRKLGEERSRWP